MAQTYTDTTGDSTGVNRLVLQYVRAESYNDAKFKQIIGAANDGFTEYVDRTHNRRLWTGYIDPKECVTVHADHWAVSTEGFLQYPAAVPGDVNWADFLGWGGDLISFYGVWRKEWGGDTGWCPDHLFTPGVRRTPHSTYICAAHSMVEHAATSQAHLCMAQPTGTTMRSQQRAHLRPVAVVVQARRLTCAT